MNGANKVCSNCGHEYEDGCGSFCSARCRSIHNAEKKKGTKVERLCVNCGVVVVVAWNQSVSHVFCEKCVIEKKLSLGNERECKECGRIFDKKYSTYASGDYCSQRCAKKAGFKSIQGKKKSSKCVNCREVIEISVQASHKTALCERCRYERDYESCSICGRPKKKTSNYCANCFRSTKEYAKSLREGIRESTKNIGGLRKGSGNGKSGRYNNVYFDSTWELAFYIHMKDLGIQLIRNRRGFPYTFGGKSHLYYPDFIVKGGSLYYEVKGYDSEQWQSKLEQFNKPIIVIMEEQIKPIIQNVEDRYGVNDLSLLYEDSKLIELTCKGCGKTFYRKKTQQYCSRSCSGKYVGCYNKKPAID